METIKQQLRQVSDGEMDFSEVKEMIPRITQAQMLELIELAAVYECIGNNEKLTDPQSSILNAILNHTIFIYNGTEKKWSDFNMMDAVFPWSGLLTRDVAGEMLKVVPDDRRKELVMSRVNIYIHIQ